MAISIFAICLGCLKTDITICMLFMLETIVTNILMGQLGDKFMRPDNRKFPYGKT